MVPLRFRYLYRRQVDVTSIDECGEPIDKSAEQHSRSEILTDPRYYQRKLIASKSRYKLVRSGATLQAASYRHEQFVADLMPQRIVNCFELVHVEEEHSDLFFWTAVLQFQAEMTTQKGSIWKVRQGVIRGQSN